MDPSRPVGLVLAAVLHFLRDEDKPYRVVAASTFGLPRVRQPRPRVP
ncbi:SAM-dependent methyltransferase [Kitasatospora sp. NPDC001159]